MNNKHLIPRISPNMLRDNPDQVSMILNEVIDRLNSLDEK